MHLNKAFETQFITLKTKILQRYEMIQKTMREKNIGHLLQVDASCFLTLRPTDLGVLLKSFPCTTLGTWTGDAPPVIRSIAQKRAARSKVKANNIHQPKVNHQLFAFVLFGFISQLAKFWFFKAVDWFSKALFKCMSCSSSSRLYSNQNEKQDP